MLNKNSVLSVGYWLGKDFHNKGYMSEACFAICNKAFNASDVKVLYIACAPENETSFKLANKILRNIKNSNDVASLTLSLMQKYTESVVTGDKEFSFNYYAGCIQKN